MRSVGSGASYEEEISRAGVAREEVLPFVREHLMTTHGELGDHLDRMLDHFDIHPPRRAGIKHAAQVAWQRDNASVTWIPGAKSLLEELRALGHELVLVTNSTEPGWRSAAKKLGLRASFDSLFLSWEMGVSKPDSRVWELVESRYQKVKPQDFWMVGDLEDDDLVVPRERGWNVFRTTGEATLGILRHRLVGNGLILIVDIPIRQDVAARFSELGFTLLDAAQSSRALCAWEGWHSMNPGTTLLLFPGNGAAITRGFLNSKWLGQWQNIATVEASRTWIPGEGDPIARVGRIMLVHGRASRINDVVVVDDVISSGATANEIRKINASQFADSTRWHVIAWVAQRAAKLEGFVRSHATIRVGLNTRKTPINSMSTFLQNPTLTEAYAARKLGHKDAAEFLEILEFLREGGKGVGVL